MIHENTKHGPFAGARRSRRDFVPPSPWVYSRRASLEKTAVRWVSDLPANVRPTQLAVRLPHIANKLASLWPTPEKCGEYLDELMIDRRGDRSGFPSAIARELATLKKFHDATLRGRSRYNAWNNIIFR